MNKITKTFFAFFLFIIIGFNGFSQNEFRVGISMGPIFPLNNFKSADYQNLSSGYSESGYSLNFDGDYYFHRRLAVSARFNFGLTSMNKVAVADWLDVEMTGYLNNNTENNLYSIDYWQFSSPLLGLKYNYPIVVNKFYFEIAAFSGLSIVQTPNQNLKIIDEVNKQAVYAENINSKTITAPLMFDGGFRYVANNNIQFKLQASYFQTKSEYEHINYIVKENSVEVSEELHRSKIIVPIQTLNFSIGIIYNLSEF